jgi:GNAT superfamily N-acetyltransferase
MRGSAAAPLTVVTLLEMQRPPERYPHMPMGSHQLALLRCREMPLHFYRYIYDRVGRDWYWTAVLLLDDEQLAKRLADPAREVHVLYMDGAPAGFFELHRLDRKECRLLLFGLMPHAIGKGLSRWFLGCAIRAAWDGGAKLVSVETCTLDHPAALPLYQKMGFVPVRRSETHAVPVSDEKRAEVLLRR